MRRLLEYLATGEDLDTFLEDFPTVGRDQAVEALARIREELLEHLA